MIAAKKHDDTTGNRLLAALPRKVFRQLLPDLEQVTLTLSDVLYNRGDVIRYVYFPSDSMVSLLSLVGNRSTLEVGVVGNEGMTGVPVILGVKKSLYKMIVQGAGTAFRMKAAALRKHAKNNGRLQVLLQLYTHALLMQVSQSATCNRFHVVEARLSRWLLATRHCLDSNEFRQTQEFLSHMLGVRREMVNKAAGILQKRQLISYTRGIIKILDVKGLETASCECNEKIKAEYDNFLGLKS